LNRLFSSIQRATKIETNNAIPYIGLGWCLIQAGRTNEAKVPLRRAVDLAWREEKKSGAHMFPITPEAIDYLSPLLDPQRDKKELDRLKAIKSDPTWNNRVVTPLVVPLEPNVAASALINTNASVAFDLDGSANPHLRWQWITTNAAWIVHLPQGGRVTSALQMFGNVTFWMFWENGYHALASLDDNADGLLTGDELRGIRLWQDRNSDGICDQSEILELSQLGITAMDTRYTNQTELLASPSGARFIDGSTRPTYDVVLRSR
jgi:hypothetical protein